MKLAILALSLLAPGAYVAQADVADDLVRALEAADADCGPAPPGFLTINTSPWTRVEIDGRFSGSTPLFRERLLPGEHKLRLSNDRLGINGPDHTVEILHWRWNQAVALADSNAAWAWEFDTDLDSLEPVDLFADNTVLNVLFGGFTPFGSGDNNPRLTNGYNLFAPLDATMTVSVNGSDAGGNNRQGRNSCYFEGGNVATVLCPDCPNDPGDLGWAGPLDNDIDDDLDGTIDEYVTTNGPIRNMDISAVNGPDMRFDKLEDLYGDTGDEMAGVGRHSGPSRPTCSAGHSRRSPVTVSASTTWSSSGASSRSPETPPSCGLSCTLDTSIACTSDSRVRRRDPTVCAAVSAPSWT